MRDFPVINGNLDAGLALLWRAYGSAQDARVDPWDFAVGIDELYEAGLTISDIRWLVAKGFAKHGQETSVYGDRHRSFDRSDGFNFEVATCLVFTPSGATFAAHILQASVVSRQSTRFIDATSIEGGETAAARSDLAAGETTQAAQKPHWDPKRRLLCLAGTIIKCFRVPARNQELILAAFQEDGWPAHIDDPLPVMRNIDSRTRLHDAINRLNGRQTNCLLAFRGNGCGSGVLWELRQPVV